MHKKFIFSIFFLVIIASGFFIISIYLRHPWFGSVSESNYQFNTGRTLVSTKNWYKEGLWKTKFLMLDNPASVEFQTLHERQPYLSYLPGASLPIYFIAIAQGKPPTPEMIMTVNLVNQFIIGILLGFISLIIFRKFKYPWTISTILSICPALLYYFTPTNLYYHQNVYFTDQAVLLPYTVAILLETIKLLYPDKKKRLLYIFQVATFSYGFSCDWFFAFILISIFALRILSKEVPLKIKGFIYFSIKFWWPIIALCVFFLWQFYVSGDGWNYFTGAFERATGVNQLHTMAQEVFGRFFAKWMVENIGLLGIILLLTSLLITYFPYKPNNWLDKKEFNKLRHIAALTIIPPILYFIFLPRNNVYHEFSIMKFVLWMSFVPFVIVPILLLNALKQKYFRGNNNLVMTIVLLLILLSYIAYETPQYKTLFPGNQEEIKAMGEFINNETDINTVVFSPVFELRTFPPTALAFAEKRIYRVNTVHDIYKKVLPLNSEYEIGIILLPHLDTCQNCVGINSLINLALSKTTIQYENREAVLYKITKDIFLNNAPEIMKKEAVAVQNVLSTTKLVDLLQTKEAFCAAAANNGYVSDGACKTLEEKINQMANIYFPTALHVLDDEIMLVDYQFTRTAKSMYRLDMLFSARESKNQKNNQYFPVYLKGFPVKEGYQVKNWSFNLLEPTSWGFASDVRKLDNNFVLVSHYLDVDDVPYRVQFNYKAANINTDYILGLGVINKVAN